MSNLSTPPYRFNYLPATFPSIKPSVDALGVNVHCFRLQDGAPLTNEQDLNLIRLAGFRRVRIDMLWSKVERQPGVLDFRDYDRVIQALRARGIKPMVILGLGNPLYSPELTIYPPHVQAAFERYVTETIKHFRGQGLIYELVNEPNHEAFWKPRPDPRAYMALAKNVLPKIKMLDPTAQVVAPSTAGTPFDFLESCFQEGLLQWVDGVTVHPYQAFYKTYPTNRNPENFEVDYQKVQQLIQKYAPTGKRIPLLLGEWGYSSALTELDEQTQANYLVRQALLGMLYGSPVNIWYDWKGDIDGLQDPNNKELNFGVVHPDLRVKPAYFAMQQLANQIGNKSLMGRLPSPSGDYVLKFANDKEAVLAYWTANTPHWLSVGQQRLLLTGKPGYATV